MFKCKECKDTGVIVLFSSSKPCLDCPPPEFDETIDITEYEKRIRAECPDCGLIVDVLPGTFGYDSLMDKSYCLAKCGGCGLGGRIFIRV